MQGAQKLRSEAHLRVRRNDEVAAQRSRWIFYETIKIQSFYSFAMTTIQSPWGEGELNHQPAVWAEYLAGKKIRLGGRQERD
jgi:hypothetical protein